mmetsp:Transcript_26154/g.59615  ORF Transcript_26154/g.59615 Transcript_26154/m.59615 type:complete len:259 (-) Transcript_26154:803-1579(-)
MAWLSNSIAASSSDFACKNSSWVAVRTVRASSITVVWSVIPTWMASILSWRSSLRSSSFSILLPSFLTSYSRSSFSLLCLFSFSIHSSLSTMSCCSSSRSLSISFSICAITRSKWPPRRSSTATAESAGLPLWSALAWMAATTRWRAPCWSTALAWTKVVVAEAKRALASSESRISRALVIPSFSSALRRWRSAQSAVLRWQFFFVSSKKVVSPSRSSMVSSRSSSAMDKDFLASDCATSRLDRASVFSFSSLILVCM